MRCCQYIDHPKCVRRWDPIHTYQIIWRSSSEICGSVILWLRCLNPWPTNKGYWVFKLVYSFSYTIEPKQRTKLNFSLWLYDWTKILVCVVMTLTTDSSFWCTESDWRRFIGGADGWELGCWTKQQALRFVVIITMWGTFLLKEECSESLKLISCNEMLVAELEVDQMARSSTSPIGAKEKR